MPVMADPHEQAVTGVTPPQIGEAIIRDVWPSVAAYPGPAGLARACYRTIVLAPIGWFVLAPIYFMKLLAVMPGLHGLATRYRLTNRRLMICKGMKPVPDKEVPLDRIKDVKLVTDANSEFFVAGTLDVIDANGQTMLTLPGVREPESVRHAILQAAAAWGP
ncbi:MAG TPA: PH domain-containing protein, partial [Gemmataceae bacterium]|nr:PH domain-containing protein [Gemmataceae bacterium]